MGVIGWHGRGGGNQCQSLQQNLDKLHHNNMQNISRSRRTLPASTAACRCCSACVVLLLWSIEAAAARRGVTWFPERKCCVATCKEEGQKALWAMHKSTSATGCGTGPKGLWNKAKTILNLPSFTCYPIPIQCIHIFAHATPLLPETKGAMLPLQELTLDPKSSSLPMILLRQLL